MNTPLERMALLQATEHLEQAAQHVRAVRHTRRDNAPRINVARLMHDLASGRAHGEDREALQEHAHQMGVDYDPSKPLIPFSAMRDLTVAGTGGYLSSVETQEPIDILRPWSVTARAGIILDTGLRGEQAVPITTGKATPYWLANEASQITPSDPVIGQKALTPKAVGALTTFSRNLALQANAEKFLSRELMRTIGTAVDQAIIAGAGGDQPLGIINTTGIATQSGTSLAYAGVTAMKQTVSEANAPDESVAFVGTPAVRKLLENRERATGSGFIWDHNQVASQPAYVTTDVPAATLVCGAWDSIYCGVWGDGFVVEINPYEQTNFKSGKIQARILISMDIALLHRAAFSVATSIT